jgi:hypothetical protein
VVTFPANSPLVIVPVSVLTISPLRSVVVRVQMNVLLLP